MRLAPFAGRSRERYGGYGKGVRLASVGRVRAALLALCKVDAGFTAGAPYAVGASAPLGDRNAAATSSPCR